jgi:ribosome-binding factor A
MDRVNDLLREAVSEIMADQLKDPRMATLVSVTRVDTSPDLGHARVYVSIMGGQEDKSNTITALKSASGYIRRNLRKSVDLKKTPALEFHLDETIERGNQVLKLIAKVAPGPESDDDK